MMVSWLWSMKCRMSSAVFWSWASRAAFSSSTGVFVLIVLEVGVYGGGVSDSSAVRELDEGTDV
jgi:hypothetical protein